MDSLKSRLRQSVEVQQAVIFIVVSLVGTVFSLPLYLLLRSEGYTQFFASPVSNLFAQAIDFFPHKLLSFKARRLDGKVLGYESILYGLVAVCIGIVEPFLLYWAEYYFPLNHLGAWLAIHPFTGTTRYLLYRKIFRKFNGHLTPSP